MADPGLADAPDVPLLWKKRTRLTGAGGAGGLENQPEKGTEGEAGKPC